MEWLTILAIFVAILIVGAFVGVVGFVIYSLITNRKYVITRYENGNKREEGILKNGKREGKWIRWWGNGNKMYEKEYKDGKPEGKYIEWYGNGNKRFEGEYKNGERVGQWIEWDENGKKIV